MEKLDTKAANNLRKIWEDHKAKTGATQTDFAQTIGMSQSNFAIYLNGHQPITLKVLHKLCTSLKCNASDIREELKDGYYKGSYSQRVTENNAWRDEPVDFEVDDSGLYFVNKKS